MTPAIPDPTHDVDSASGTRADSRSSPQPSAVPAPLAPDGEASALLALAERVNDGRWYEAVEFIADGYEEEDSKFIAACSPERIIALLTTLTARTAALAEAEARAERAEKHADNAFRRGYDEGWEDGRFSTSTHPNDEHCRDKEWTFKIARQEFDAALASASPEPTTEPT